MKMQEVILRLRESAPAVETCTRDALRGFDSLHDVLRDASHTGSQESLRSLLSLCLEKSQYIRGLLQNASAEAEKLNGVNMAYREKLGPRAKKPKDAPGQQMLPGFEDEGGTPTTMGDTPTMMGRTPSFMQSGRHG